MIYRPEHLCVRSVDVVQGSLWRNWPMINVDKTKDIPCDYPGPMAVPITFLDKYNPNQYEVLGITDGHHRLETGRLPYRRVIVRNLYPKLPEEIDLVEWLGRCGLVVEVERVRELPEGASVEYRAKEAQK